jgi:hypothetical protein
MTWSLIFMLPICCGYLLPPAMLAELAEVPSRIPVSGFCNPLTGRLSGFSSLLRKRFKRDVTVLTRDIVPATECIELADDPLALRRRPAAEKWIPEALSSWSYNQGERYGWNCEGEFKNKLQALKFQKKTRKTEERSQAGLG